MKKLLILCFVCFLGEISIAQNAPEQDCINAIPICQNVYSTLTTYIGEGTIPNEINPANSCLTSGELNDVWYTFTVQTSGNCSFLITPNNLNDDYDWAVFNLTNANCSDIFSNPALEVSCNYSATFGATGPNGGSAFNAQGAGGTPFNAVIPVLAGETYVINISNNSTVNQSGYTIDFSTSTAQIFDNIPPRMVSVDTPIGCGTSAIVINFSENILCSTVQSTDFIFTGPGGSYTVNSVISPVCAAGGNHDKIFTMNFTPPIHTGGTYYIHLVDTVTDLCGNVGIYDSLPIVINSGVTCSAIHTDVSCFGNTDGTATATGAGGTGPYTYLWSNGATTNSISGLSAGTYTVIGTDNTGCGGMTIVTINAPPPITGSTSAVSSCIGDPTTITSSFTGLGPYTYHFVGDSGLNVNSTSPIIMFIFPGAGSYNYTVTASDANGCQAIATGVAVVAPNPQAAFSWTIVNGYTVNFANYSSGNPDWWHWTFGDGSGSSDNANAVYTYNTDTGTYTVWLYIMNAGGCRDSIEEFVTLGNLNGFYIPSSFSPNGDHKNDFFTISTNEDIRFVLTIFDRWGQEIFKTSDLSTGWDGNFADGKKCPIGMYVYSVYYSTDIDIGHTVVGRVMLVR